jgi:hypothetical protein
MTSEKQTENAENPLLTTNLIVSEICCEVKKGEGCKGQMRSGRDLIAARNS